MAYLGALFFILGGAAFGFLVPALAGYIAYAIADRPGIAPGFVMGAVAGCIVNSGLPRRHRRRCARRRRRALDRRLEGADLGARPDAGPGHPAAHHPGRRAS